MAVSPAEIQSFLQGVSYPATKEALVEHAKTNGAPEEIVEALEEMEDAEYGGPQDVMKEFGEE